MYVTGRECRIVRFPDGLGYEVGGDRCTLGSCPSNACLGINHLNGLAKFWYLVSPSKMDLLRASIDDDALMII